MTFLYWRPRHIPRAVLTALAIGSLTSLLLIERYPSAHRQDWYAEKLSAAETASAAMDVIRRERISRGHQWDPRYDPAGSGMIGAPASVTTTNSGDLAAKQTSVNPNFAAVVVDLLKQAGVESGDTVAVGCTGSFPALNLCVLAAVETLECRPLVISSATASQYGANLPDLFWIDMERLIVEAGVFQSRSGAVSMGGSEDRALRMSDEAQQLIRQAIDRSGLPFIDAPSYEASLDARTRLYQQWAGDAPIRAYINVGSGAVSVGRSRGMKYYDPGLNLTPPPGATQIDSVMSRFARAGVPVIHLAEVKQLARRYGLPLAPTARPLAGESPLHVQYRPNRILAGLAMGLILLCTYLGVLQGKGNLFQAGMGRWFNKSRSEAEPDEKPHLELMV